MFHDIPQKILDRMAFLETSDARDRQDGTPKSSRLRQIPPETGKMLALLAANAPEGAVLEIGTSGGYSGLWLALACRQRGDRLVSFDISAKKVSLARETFAISGVQDLVEVHEGDARDSLQTYARIAFCFLDAEKDIYKECYEQVVPNLVRGGILAADNAISHEQELGSFIEQVKRDRRVDALVVPIGKGLLICRKA